MDSVYKYPSVTAKVLRNLRLKNNYTQENISTLIGKSRATISRIENALKKLSTSELKEYLEFLNTSSEDFLNTISSLNLLNDLGAQYSESSDFLEKKVDLANTNVINNRDEIIDFLKSYFVDKPVKEVYLFGSVARNNYTDKSDIDIYLDFEKNVNFSVFDLSKMKVDITAGTGRETDLVLKGSEYSFIKESLESDKVKIYG